jgi:hypothetical protein
MSLLSSEAWLSDEKGRQSTESVAMCGGGSTREDEDGDGDGRTVVDAIAS